MIKRLKANIFPSIIALSALSVSLSAAFYSVSGLSKLFAGASFEVIIMAASLEVAKLVIASLLYQYWSTLNKLLRTYLTVSAVVLVLITSMGIYGFLSAAYQETYSKLNVSLNEISFLESKAKFYEDDVIRYDAELERISNNIGTLSSAKSQQIQYTDADGTVRNTVSTAELRLAQSRIATEEVNRQEVNKKRTIAADSLQKYRVEILELQNNSEIAAELGPLQYLSGLTGAPMDKIINILLLVIIFVFDPLAISLVVAANFAFDQANKKNLYDEYEDEIEPDLWNDLDEEELPDNWKDDLKNYDEENERRMDIIGQNGNEGEHYNVDINNVEVKVSDDWQIRNEDDSEIAEKKVKRVLQKSPTKKRVEFTDGSEGWVNKGEENTDKITYL